MAQFDSTQQNGGETKTIAQLFHAERMTSITGKIHDHEYDHLHHGKKISVIAKVKEKAKKWRQNLSKKKHGHDGYHAPAWGVALEDYELDDDHDNVESLGNESEHTLKSSKESNRHHQGPNGKKYSNDQVKQKHPAQNVSTGYTTAHTLIKSLSDNQAGNNQSLTGANINESPRAKSLGSHLREKQGSPTELSIDALIAQRNDNIKKEKEENHALEEAKCLVDEIISLEQNNEASSPKNVDEEGWETPGSPTKTTFEDAVSYNSDAEEQEQQYLPAEKSMIESDSEATNMINSEVPELSVSNLKTTEDDRRWDKGVSVKEYLKHKLEPGEDERVLSQIITEAISPRRSPGEKGVVQKVRTAVSMLLRAEEPSSSSLKITRSFSQIPVSTNAQEVEEEKQGCVLQE